MWNEFKTMNSLGQWSETRKSVPEHSRFLESKRRNGMKSENENGMNEKWENQAETIPRNSQEAQLKTDV